MDWLHELQHAEAPDDVIIVNSNSVSTKFNGFVE